MSSHTSLQRVLTTLSHQEPDRTPLFLLLTMHGAKELGLTIKDYFSKAENVIKGQLKLRAKYGHDCIFPFFYAPVEIEAWGGEVVYREDGPPNSGEPLLRKPEDILKLDVPDVRGTACLKKVLEATEGLKREIGDEAPIIGVAMSPFSLPVMQMGFERYLDIMHERQDLFERLMTVNEEFCVQWANAQLDAGATAICYFDPVSSSSIITRDKYLETGFKVARRTIARINGPTATHFASGRCIPILDDVKQTGTAVVGVSILEDLSEIKRLCRDQLTVLGNLNGVEMRRWTTEEAEEAVRSAINKAAPGGGFILADNHGEIPWQVPDDVLMAISDATRRWGEYPINVRT